MDEARAVVTGGAGDVAGAGDVSALGEVGGQLASLEGAVAGGVEVALRMAAKRWRSNNSRMPRSSSVSSATMLGPTSRQVCAGRMPTTRPGKRCWR
jgi:hypothetical protein